MKKISKKIALGALVLAPFMFAPQTSRANFISDLVHWLKGDKDHKEHKDHNGNRNDRESTGNSVPIDGGIVFLVAAGLGLGAKMLYDYNKKSKTQLIQ